MTTPTSKPPVWEVAWTADDRPPTEMIEGLRFYALVGPDPGWPRRNPRPTIARQRWSWKVALMRPGRSGKKSTRYKHEAEGHASSQESAKACAEAVLRILGAIP